MAGAVRLVVGREVCGAVFCRTEASDRLVCQDCDVTIEPGEAIVVFLHDGNLYGTGPVTHLAHWAAGQGFAALRRSPVLAARNARAVR